MNATRLSNKIEKLAQAPQVRSTDDLVFAYDMFESDENKLACALLLIAMCEA